MNKFLYFRTVADEANDGVTGLKTNTPSSFLFPADSLTSMQPTGDAALTLYFKPALLHGHSAESVRDTVILNVTEGDIFEVMAKISDAIANPSRGHSDGFIVVADDVTTTDSGTTALNDLAVAAQYIHSSITSCGAITVNNPSGGYGIHEYYEVVDLGTGDSGDNCGEIGVYLPAQAVLIEGAMVPVELASNAYGAVALHYHSASVDFDSAGGGTEWIGAGSSGTTSIPNADCDVDSAAGAVGKAVHSGTAAKVARGSAATYISLVAQEDLSSMGGTPKVGVYVKWAGGAGIAYTQG